MTDGVTTDELSRLLVALTNSRDHVVRDDADRIDRIRLFEELKAAIGAAQASEAVAFDRSQRARQAVAGQLTSAQGRGVAAQLALARRTSPWVAQRWLGQAKILTTELPGIFAELRAGRTSEWRALLVARETAALSREDRAAVDRELAGRVQGWGDGQVEREARRAACRIDPGAAVARARRAETERRVTIRPVPDTMCRVTALLPVAQGVGVYAALSRFADLHVGHGDESRGRHQVMADEFVQRLTATESADERAEAVEIQLVMTDQALLNAGPGRDEPALLTARGVAPIPIPAAIARDLALNADTRGGADGERWLRRLYAQPGTGQLLAMDSTGRAFTAGQQRFLRARDQVCRTPWCSAPIRHADHVRRHADGGPTSVGNGAGLCEACNQAKEAMGWTAIAAGDLVTVTTPTGHCYRSRAPDLPRASRVELYFAAQLRRTAA